LPGAAQIENDKSSSGRAIAKRHGKDIRHTPYGELVNTA
jgi:hypothetical protein